jgi:hypothetical protein
MARTADRTRRLYGAVDGRRRFLLAVELAARGQLAESEGLVVGARRVDCSHLDPEMGVAFADLRSLMVEFDVATRRLFGSLLALDAIRDLLLAYGRRSAAPHEIEPLAVVLPETLDRLSRAVEQRLNAYCRVRRTWATERSGPRSDQRSARISPRRIPVAMASTTGSSKRVPATDSSRRSAREASTTTGSGRSAGRLRAVGRVPFHEAPSLRLSEGVREDEVQVQDRPGSEAALGCEQRGVEMLEVEGPERGEQDLTDRRDRVQPDERLIAHIGARPDATPHVSQPPAEECVDGEGLRGVRFGRRGGHGSTLSSETAWSASVARRQPARRRCNGVAVS